MAEKLETFEFKRNSKEPRFAKVLDGSIWKITPDEFDCDTAKQLVGAVKAEARKLMNRYVRTAQVFDGSVVVQLRPEGYKPMYRGGRVKAKAKPSDQPVDQPAA